jgi:tetratricopeptide (TPR) repeat protein/precorrin-6B methylase 2
MRLRLAWGKSANDRAPADPTARGTAAGDPRADFSKACALYDAGRVWEAYLLFRRLRGSGFDAPGFARRLGWSHYSMARYEDAEGCMREAVAKEPDAWQSHFGLAEVQRERNPHVARAGFLRALSLDQENEHCLLALSACCIQLKDGSGAEAAARRVIELAPDHARGWINLGCALLMQDRLVEADQAFVLGERLVDTSSDDANAVNRGVVLRLQGRTAEAIQYYEARLGEQASVSAHAHYALALLTAGRFDEGWDQYEFRWLDDPLIRERARYDRPSWDGQELQGKTILVRCEQGAGDVFQFIRYAPYLKKLGATVLLELHLELGILGKGFAGVDRTFMRGQALPHFDYFIDLLSLPHAFRTTETSIPGVVPYLEPPGSWDPQWRDRLARFTGLKVGVVWAGDARHPRDRQRSMPLAMLEPLFQLPRIAWFSLQKGLAAGAASDRPIAGSINSLGSQLYEYADTAAAIRNLDLVVAVDTSVAHLAGALGKPVWLLLPFVADWRWMEGRETTPWYPTMRIFRQTKPDDWQGVVERVQLEIARLAAAPSEGSRTESIPSVGRVPDVKPLARSRHHPSNASAIPRVCRTRLGMIQFVPNAHRNLSRCLEYYGDYLHSELDLIRSLVNSGDVIVEVSAGIGVRSIALAGGLGVDGQVLAIEESSVLRRILRQNLEANEVRGVQVMPPAAALQTVDELGFDRVDIVIANATSGIAKVVDAGIETLQRCAPILMFTEQPVESLHPLARTLTNLSYRCWRVETALFDPANFNCRRDDIFDGERSYALFALPKRWSIPDPIATRPGVAPLV